jgi:hypothetical protein
MGKSHTVTIEFLGILLLGSFRLSIDGIPIGESTFRKGCVLGTEVSSGKHILSTEIWPYWLSFLTKKEFPFEIERDIQRKDYSLSYSRFWGKFSELTATNTVYWKGKSNKKDDEILQSPYQTLPPSATPPDTISKEKTQESYSKEKVIKSEKNTNVEETSIEKLEKLIGKRNNGDITSEEFEEMKKEILEKKPQFSNKSAEIELEESQTDKNVIEIQDSAISESNVVHSDDDRFTKLKDLTEMKEKGFIDDDEFKQMKKEILGK